VAHVSENTAPLSVRNILVPYRDALAADTRGFPDVCVLVLPSCKTGEEHLPLEGMEEIVADVLLHLGKDATLVTLGDPVDLVHVLAAINDLARYQLWIAIQRRTILYAEDASALPRHHFGALVHTRYDGPLQHTKTRIPYAYCPACDKTTKDYGGKKHTYHELGTLMSDVWRDTPCDLEGDIAPVIERFAHLFGIEPYRELRVFDLRSISLRRAPAADPSPCSQRPRPNEVNEPIGSRLVRGDCLEELRRLPSASVDLAFADPPYNLSKRYSRYADDLEVEEYFAWCDEWIAELARVLKRGRSCILLNIPLWAVRHFTFLETELRFQNWIAWDAISFPVRFIMPAHYALIGFSKGIPRPLPGLTGESTAPELPVYKESFLPLRPMREDVCRRARCVRRRRKVGMDDRGPLTDLWWDIPRLKHNSRREDHPCQVPPQLMYRLLAAFTKPGEVVLDCFNGIGTTTLSAHHLGRRYIGIELDEAYHAIAESRHREIKSGLPPFRTIQESRTLTAKNSPVPRMPKRRYEVPKRTLQLDVRRVARELGRLPTREEMAKHGRYPIRYYDEYFVSWGEVCAAARTTGMREDRPTTGPRPVKGAVPAPVEIPLRQPASARRATVQRPRRCLG
jgi:site-specific DNA-methyltransferase (adenine-specific)